jgi:branched-chain amino acid aminotransferase
MPVFYVNGEFVDSNDAVIPVTDLSIIRGYGAFDFLRTYGGKPFRLMANIQRLRRSCEQIYLEFPWTDGELHFIVMETVRRNAFPEASIRILITGGISPDNITPTGNPSLLVMVAPLKPQPAHWYTDGVKVITREMDRIVPGAKSINYIPAIMALRHAGTENAIEALYVSYQGNVLEGTTSNLFAFYGDTLVTPGETILPGITRNVVLELAQGVFNIEIRSIPREALYRADEVFITASNKQVVPVVQVDDRTIGSGKVGERTQRIMALFKAETERSARSESEPVK